MNVWKTSLLIQFTTDPVDENWATKHTGGWSEGVWTTYLPTPIPGGIIREWAQKRSFLLPTQAAIVGFRISQYDLSNNKLTPAGTSAGKLIYPGNHAYTVNNPQSALELGWPAQGGANQSRIVLRGVPDEVIVNGEFNGNATFRTSLTLYTNVLTNRNFGWIGRDLSQPSAVVNMIAGNVVTLSVPLAGLAAGDFLRFRKVRNDGGTPIKGSFLVTNVAGANLTLQGYTGGNVTKPNGTARKDIVTFLQGGTPQIGRTVVKKVGRPFESYRGRRSKIRA